MADQIIEDQELVQKFIEVSDVAILESEPDKNFEIDEGIPSIQSKVLVKSSAYRSGEVSEFFWIASDGPQENIILIPKRGLSCGHFGKLMQGNNDVEQIFYNAKERQLEVNNWRLGNPENYINRLHLAKCSSDYTAQRDANMKALIESKKAEARLARRLG